MSVKLNGWDEIVYIIIKEKFRNESFFLSELYAYENYFQNFYPHNFSIRSQLRKTLVNLRERGLLEFQFRGVYRLLELTIPSVPNDKSPYYVYLFVNDALKDWVLIGHARDYKKKLKSLNLSNLPLPYRVVETHKTANLEKAQIVERLIITLIETMNEEAVYNKASRRKNFLRLEEAKVGTIFSLVRDVFSLVNDY